MPSVCEEIKENSLVLNCIENYLTLNLCLHANFQKLKTLQLASKTHTHTKTRDQNKNE
jgi:hypothetical protein